MKDITTLGGLVEEDWNDANCENIREFFSYPRNTILTIYYYEDVLTTDLNIPTVPVHELTYIVKQSNEKFAVENFHDNVIFGTINENVEATILKLSSNLLAPAFFNINTWPDSILVHAKVADLSLVS